MMSRQMKTGMFGTCSSIIILLLGMVAASYLAKRDSLQASTTAFSHVPKVSNAELREIVGFCPRCCIDLGTCNALDWQPCTEDAMHLCTDPGKICSNCTPADTVDLCTFYNALPGDVCTTIVIACNPAQPVYACKTTSVGCRCLRVPGSTMACGQSANCSSGSVYCP
jgi:hypothetical protein